MYALEILNNVLERLKVPLGINKIERLYSFEEVLLIIEEVEKDIEKNRNLINIIDGELPPAEAYEEGAEIPITEVKYKQIIGD